MSRRRRKTGFLSIIDWMILTATKVIRVMRGESQLKGIIWEKITSRIESMSILRELKGYLKTRQPRQDEEKGMGKAGRHRSGLSMGFPVRQAGRHNMAIQKKSSRMVKKEWIPKDLIHRIFHSSRYIKFFCSSFR